MPDATELVRIIKRAAMEANSAANPVTICYGTVLSSLPLQIQVEQKLILGPRQLVLSRNVTDFKTLISMEWKSEKMEKNEITIHNGLVVGEKVILLRQQEGQKFIVWDRVGI